MIPWFALVILAIPCFPMGIYALSRQQTVAAYALFLLMWMLVIRSLAL